MESAVTTESRTQRRSIFARVLVGVDGSSQSVEAARQAAMLAEGWVGLLAVYDIAPRVVGGAGIGVPSYYDEGFQRANAGAALAEVKAAVKGLSTATRGMRCSRRPAATRRR